MPAIWCLFLIAFILLIPKVHAGAKLSKRDIIYAEALICAVLLIATKILLGTVLGEIGGSPYDLSAGGIFGNLFFVLPALAARETVRSYVLCTYCSKRNIKAFTLITLAMTVFSINFTKLSMVSSFEAWSIFFATEAGPKLSQSIILSYLGFYGGPIAAILYIWGLEVFHWISPVLSSLNWLAEGAAGILIPIGCVIFLTGKYESKRKAFMAEKRQKWGTAGWSLIAAFSIGLLWFVVGVFPIVPSVIATGSMEPLIYPGDVILLRQTRTEDQVRSLAAGDIIQFNRDNIRITHRIVEVLDDGIGNIEFRTKGDNNSGEDSRLVHPNDVTGTLIDVIPKIGYPTLLLKGSTKVEIDSIEF
ncbi:hypothetical protein MASR2M70_02400 [Bacillota bacterium]